MIREAVSLTLSAGGGGTVQTSRPLWGCISEIRYNGGTAFIGTGTATFTRADDDGAILAVAPGTAGVPFSYAPRQDTHTQTAGTVTYDGTNIVNDKIPLDGYVQIVVLGGGSVQTGTFHIYVE